MLKKERQRLILEEVTKNKKVLAAELSKEFNCSEDTIRRDLRELDQKGLLKRIHSGATSIGPSVTSFDQRISTNVEIKERLAQRGVSLLNEDSVILIDGGSTNYYLVKELPNDFTATIVTNSPFITIELLNKRNVTVITLGGIFAKRASVSLGVEALEALDSLRIDTYVMGIYNFHPEFGMSVHSQQESLIKRKMSEVSDEIIALATSDKLGVYSNYICCPPKKIDFLVTDSSDALLLNEFRSQNIALELV